MTKIEEYTPIVGQAVIDELRLLGERLAGRRIKNVNSTAVGGGVAEILMRMIPLLGQLGVNAEWDVIRGDDHFFVITKKFHNALHGVHEQILDEDLAYFLEINRQNASTMDLDCDILFIHDPQPVALIEHKRGGRWLWRCHIDFSRPDERVWAFLKGYVSRYDGAVFSAPSFARMLGIRQILISPSIDPLSNKNRELSDEQVNEVLDRFGIQRDKPIITQISRFDYLKDPLGVVKAYQLVKEHLDCQLVLAGGGATDDPEGAQVLAEVQQAAAGDPDVFILFLPPASDLEINALQRASDVVLQKSLREGFGLTVSEALWKGKPVIASAVGGIPLQIAHKYSGILTHSVEGTAYWIKQLLQAPDFARKLGQNGREHVRNNFLITRHVREYLLAFLAMEHRGDVIQL